VKKQAAFFAGGVLPEQSKTGGLKTTPRLRDLREHHRDCTMWERADRWLNYLGQTFSAVFDESIARISPERRLRKRSFCRP
jgi:hypothetical protein